VRWFYQIRDADGEVFEESNEEFVSEDEARGRGEAEKQRLQHTGNAPPGGFGSVTAKRRDAPLP
jgi:hypothetical protein